MKKNVGRDGDGQRESGITQILTDTHMLTDVCTRSQPQTSVQNVRTHPVSFSLRLCALLSPLTSRLR